MSDWPSLLVTGLSSGLAGSLAGLGGSYLLARASIRGVEGETERLEAAHREEHLRHRQAVYHDYLDVLAELANLTTRSRLTAEDMTRWFSMYTHCHNAVMLFGVPDVMDAANDGVRPAVLDLIRTYDAGRNGVIDKLRIAFDTHGERLGEERHELVERMRADVAPGATWSVRGQ